MAVNFIPSTETVDGRLRHVLDVRRAVASPDDEDGGEQANGVLSLQSNMSSSEMSTEWILNFNME